MAAYKEQFFDQFEHCSNKELAAIARNTKHTLPLKCTLTVIMEYIICRVMLMGKPLVSKWRSMTLEKLKCVLSTRTFKAFEYLCEMSYRKHQIDKQNGLPGEFCYALAHTVRKEKRLFPLFDDRTICDVYPLAPTNNLFLMASTELEQFLSAVHLINEPVNVMKHFIESVLQNGTNENMLIYFFGLARKHRSSPAFQALPHLLQYMWHEITDHETAVVSPRLKIVIRCYYESNYSAILRTCKSNSKSYRAMRILNSFSALGYFLSSTKGQHIVESYISGYTHYPAMHVVTDKTGHNTKYWQLPPCNQDLAAPQTPSIHDYFQHAREDTYKFGRIIVPSFPQLPITVVAGFRITHNVRSLEQLCLHVKH